MLRAAKMIKLGAKINGIQPEMAIAYTICCSVCSKYGVPCVLTEGTGGKHMSHSKHYIGMALDIRKRDLPKDQVVDFVRDLKAALGSQFDVVDEPTHFHIEFDLED